MNNFGSSNNNLFPKIVEVNGRLVNRRRSCCTRGQGERGPGCSVGVPEAAHLDPPGLIIKDAGRGVDPEPAEPGIVRGEGEGGDWPPGAVLVPLPVVAQVGKPADCASIELVGVASRPLRGRSTSSQSNLKRCSAETRLRRKSTPPRGRSSRG
jgi:hypothetical protein